MSQAKLTSSSIIFDCNKSQLGGPVYDTRRTAKILPIRHCMRAYRIKRALNTTENLRANKILPKLICDFLPPSEVGLKKIVEV